MEPLTTFLIVIACVCLFILGMQIGDIQHRVTDLQNKITKIDKRLFKMHLWMKYPLAREKDDFMKIDD